MKDCFNTFNKFYKSSLMKKVRARRPNPNPNPNQNYSQN